MIEGLLPRVTSRSPFVLRQSNDGLDPELFSSYEPLQANRRRLSTEMTGASTFRACDEASSHRGVARRGAFSN